MMSQLPSPNGNPYLAAAHRLLTAYQLRWLCHDLKCPRECPLFETVQRRRRQTGRFWSGVGSIITCTPDNAWDWATFAHEVGHRHGSMMANQAENEALAWRMARILTTVAGLEWTGEMEANHQGSSSSQPE